MRINNEQQAILERLKCVRLDKTNEMMLSTISSPLVNGQETGIDKLFKSSQELESNRNKSVASYLVIGDCCSIKTSVVMLFFSIRTGELFKQSSFSPEQIELATDMLQALNIYKNNKSNLSQHEIQFLMKAIRRASENGIDIDQAKKIVDFHASYIQDKKKEPSEGINRVLEVFSGIELKLFGVNGAVKDLWNSFQMPRSMGETLFWQFVIPKVEEVRSLVGVEYLYLFAADNTPDEHLINYYQSRLCMNCDGELSTNKPRFDYQCRFLYQRIDELLRMRDDFFQNFTPDNPI